MILAITGFTASGKDTLAKELSKSFNFVTPTTTRPRREGEVDNYHFIPKDQFMSNIEQKKFIEHRSYNTNYKGVKDIWYYGTAYSDISPGTNIVVTDLEGLQYFKNSEIPVKSVFLNVDVETRRDRCKSRGDYDETEFLRRLVDDASKYPLIRILSEVDRVLVNASLEESIEKVHELLCE